MATNVFFSHAVKSEQNLVEDLIVESLRFYGHNCYYLPRSIVNEIDNDLFYLRNLSLYVPTICENPYE